MTHPHNEGSPTDDGSLSRAMFLYGFAMFMMVYMVQPLMPRYVAEFSIAPSVASQALSAATAGMALFLIPASLYANRFRPRPLLVGGLMVCALLSVGIACVRQFSDFVVLRFVFGVMLSALPATALAYLAESVDAGRLGRVVGLYIAGNAMGGMSGRLVALALSEWMDWRFALASMGLFALGVGIYMVRALPDVRPRVATDRGVPERIRVVLSDPGQWALFGIAFLLSGCIVSVYNYISFRLSVAPYAFGYKALCAIYGLYVVGMLGSARAGRLSDRLGRGSVLIWLPVVMATGLALTMADGVVAIMVGIGLLTFGFFAGHSVASGWVSARSQQDRALASSLYLSFYYLGASVLGTAAGAAWAGWGWSGVAAFNSASLVLALLLAAFLKKLRPLPLSQRPSSTQRL